MSAFDRLLEHPWGPHDPHVAELNLMLRVGPVAGKLVLLALPNGRFALAKLPLTRPGEIELLGPEYDSVLEGERAILRLRWEILA